MRSPRFPFDARYAWCNKRASRLWSEDWGYSLGSTLWSGTHCTVLSRWCRNTPRCDRKIHNGQGCKLWCPAFYAACVGYRYTRILPKGFFACVTHLSWHAGSHMRWLDIWEHKRLHNGWLPVLAFLACRLQYDRSVFLSPSFCSQVVYSLPRQVYTITEEKIKAFRGRNENRVSWLTRQGNTRIMWQTVVRSKT